MCVVSMIGDHYHEKFTNPVQWPGIQPHIQSPPIVLPSPISREEFDALRREVEEMKILLRRAKIYDEENDEPECEMEEKVALLRKVAELVGIDLEVLKAAP